MKGSVRKRGTTWSYYFNIGIVNGKRKKKEKGGFQTKTAAEAALRKAIYDYEHLGEIFEHSKISVEDYFNTWFKDYVEINCKLNTKRYYRGIIDNHIIPYFKDYKLYQLKPGVLQEFLNTKKTNGYSINSVKNFYGVLSGALKYAVYPCNYINNNPMTHVKLPKYDSKVIEKTDFKIITIEDFNKIINRFPQNSCFYIPLQIAFYTGMRGGEVLALTWDNIDFINKKITVKHTLIEQGTKENKKFVLGTPKTKSSYRTIGVGKQLIDLLAAHKEYQNLNKQKYKQFYTNSNFVCTKENGQLVTTNTLKYLNRVVNHDLNIKFSMHSLRHTHATLLLENGANMKAIQERLGHSKLATTMDTYSHLTDNINTSTVDIFENIVLKTDTYI